MNTGEEEVKQEAKEISQAEREKQMRYFAKKAQQELNDYKKRLKASVELKRLQTEELELNIKYFELAKAWDDMQKDVQEYEAQKLAQEQQTRAEMEKKQSNIITPKIGKPRK